MKTLEERLRKKRIGVGTPWLISIEGEAPRKVFSEYIVRYDDALAIVADAPRIYRGEEIKDAPCGVYAFRQQGDPRWIGLCGNTYQYYNGMEFFGPLPTNSPSEGKE